MKKLDAKTESRIEEIINTLTLEQKVGQMNQFCSWAGTVETYGERIRRGEFGTMICGVANFSEDGSAEKGFRDFHNALQKIAVEESPCGIPLMFGGDVIHCYNVCYPVGMGSAASFDPELVERCYRNISEACARDGLNWTFSPVLDLAHDPRWGRCVESEGEDPYLAGQIGAAMVRGFQKDLDNTDNLISCPKHYIGYGAMDGGRDYHNCDISDYFMENWYATPYRAAVDAGALTVMSSFNSVSGEPVTSSKKLLRGLLKGQMGFDGFVISDYDAVMQLVNQGVAEDLRECAKLAAEGGVDMEMVQTSYLKYLCELVRSGELDEEVINESVRRVLRVKFAANLFDNPYKEYYPIDIDRHVADARQIASENVVLLKNKNNILPLKSDDRVFMAGPFFEEKISQIGAWASHIDFSLIHSYREALSDIVTMVEVEDEYDVDIPENNGDFAQAKKYKEEANKACFIGHSNHAMFGEAISHELLDNYKAIVLFLGEVHYCTGEAVSVADINIPEDQVELVRKAHATGLPVIGVMNFGRPRAIGEIEHMLDAIVWGWHNGTMNAEGMLDVLYGKKNPCGRLPMTILRHVGQIPLYYNAPNTARRVNAYYGEGRSYFDMKSSPAYPFGYGLSYTTFEYSAPETDRTEIALSDIDAGETVKITVKVKNTGELAGKEVIQCYVRDHFATMMRPRRQLVKFEKPEIAAGETYTATFEIGKRELGYWLNGEFIVEKGKFTVYVGENCYTENGVEIEVI